jgi:prophage regulatory protein
MRSLLRRSEVESRTGLPTSTLYRLIAEKRFPSPIPLAGSPRMVAWDSMEVDAWVDAQIRAARPESPAIA